MEIITIDKTNYRTGTVVNNLDSILWVERYLEPGEFKIVCDATPALRTQLALGTFISHVDTTEVMVVENHSIDEKYGESPKLEVTGRSLDCFLEKRIVSTTGITAFNTANGEANDYAYLTTPSGFAAYTLTQFLLLSTFSTKNIVPNLSIILDSSIPTVSAVERSVKKGSVLAKEVIEVLGGANLGIRFERPAYSYTSTPVHHYDSVNDPNALKMALYVHAGVDRSQTVWFVYDTGDIQQAKYLWSNKDELTLLNSCTSYAEMNIDSPYYAIPPTDWGNKSGFVDVTDINKKVAGNATETNRQVMILTAKALDAFAQVRSKTMVEATISPNSRWAYRTNYLVGDKVTVIGNYGVSSVMRVIENAEAFDETGYSSFPTLGQV